ncbi:MAG: LysM peptidoglycan-binding domain-containing protein [Chloroflexota bacterium]|nr:LysM peptidoglycan-binding domain-containing protein [Chloroflexota bacterium]
MRGRFAWLLVLMMLTLAGCYRPAGDAIEPTVAPPVDPATGGDSLLPTTPPLMLETPTLPPVTIISPTQRATLVIGQPLDALTPTQTPPPAPTLVSNPTQAGFVTPGLPIGQVTLVLPTSTPALPPTNTPSGLITPTALGGVTDECTYVVQAGDNLFRIAVNNDVSLEDMRAANPDLVGEAPVLQPGQVLRLPNCVSAGSTPAVSGAGTPGIVIATTAPISGATPAPFGTPAPAGGTTYTVQPGDTLFSIAQRFNTTIDAIIEANDLDNPNSLDVGQQLIIPAAGS